MDRRLLRSLVPPRDRIGPDAGCNDARLLDRYGDSRDERAFEELLTRHGPTVWGVCRRMLARREDAEDAFQATFVVLIRLAESGKRPRNLPGWLVKVAGRISSNVRREAGRSRRRQAASAKPESMADVPEASYDAAYAAFREEVAALPDGLRAAYLLCELGGTPQPQAAAQLGLKPSALSARLTRARQRLEARMVARGLAPSIAAAVLAGTATTLVAMPTRLVIAAQSLGAQTVVIPCTLSALAATGVPAVITKLKLVTLGGLAAAAVGFTLGAGAGLMPGAAAQAEKPAPPTAEAPKPGPPILIEQRRLLEAATLHAQEVALLDNAAQLLLLAQKQNTAKFEYHIHDFPTAADQFKKLLESEAIEGFEFAGVTPPATDGGARFTPLVVFKRPNSQVAVAGAGSVVLNERTFDIRPSPDAKAERINEAREAVAAAAKLAVAPRTRLQKLIDGKVISMDSSPELRSAEATLSLLAKADESLRGQSADAASTAHIYLDEVHEALKTAKEAELSAAVRIAIEAVKRAEGERPPPAVPVLPQQSDPPLGGRLPPPVAEPSRQPVPLPVDPLPVRPVPSPDVSAEPYTQLRTVTAPPDPSQEIARLKAELDQTKRELEAQKTKAVEPYYVGTSETCTPEQAMKIIASLKALGVHEDTRPSVPNDIGVVSILVSNARPGDAALAEAMIRALGTPPIRVTPPRTKPDSPKGSPASSPPVPTPPELPKPEPAPTPVQLPPLGPPRPLPPSAKP